MNHQSVKPGLNINILTIIALSVIVYIIQNILHELIGHGGACYLSGSDPVSFSTAYFEYDHETMSDSLRRLIASAGSIVNLLTGLFFWVMLKKIRVRSSEWRFFLWLSMTVNLLTATGYPLFSGIIGFGDWIHVIEGVEFFWFWRVILILTGAVLYVISIWISLRELNLLIGEDDSNRLKRALILTVIPYLSGSAASTIGAFLNPISMLFVITSAASSFGGTSALAWMSQLFKTNWFKKQPLKPLEVELNWFWIMASIIILLIHISIIGPGFKL